MGSTYVNDFNILGPDLPGDRAGRQPVPAVDPRRRGLRTRSHPATWCRSAPVATFRDITGPYRVPRYNLYPAAEIQGATLPGFSTGQAIAAMEKTRGREPAAGFGFEWTEIALQEKVGGQHRRDRVRPRRGVRVPAARGAIREHAAAAGGDPDRADVPARGDQRRAAARHGQQHPHPDRLRRADRPCRQERDPDRRVRQAGRGGGRGPLGRCGAGGAHAAAADPDDVVRLHPRRGAAGDRHRRRRRDAPGARHRGVLRHARRDAVRPAVHAGVLRGDALDRRTPWDRKPTPDARQTPP